VNYENRGCSGPAPTAACVAADLTNAGLDVVLIDQWPAHVEAMRAKPGSLSRSGRARSIAKVRAHHLGDLRGR